MNRRFTAPYFLTLAFALGAAGLRLWNLIAGVDDRGLPVMHLSMVLLLILGGVFLATALICALGSPGRCGRHYVLHYNLGSYATGMVAAGLILVGACVEFAEALVAGPGISAPIMLLLGLLGGVCCFLTVSFRRRGDRCCPPAELMPILYLLIKLILNFKGWSTDPIILDYCLILFALIFSLLAFYYGAGFVFDQGKPRRTLFCAMGAVFFCAGAMMDGFMDLSFSTVITYGGFLRWQLPVIWGLLLPCVPDPKKTRDAKENGN